MRLEVAAAKQRDALRERELELRTPPRSENSGWADQQLAALPPPPAPSTDVAVWCRWLRGLPRSVWWLVALAAVQLAVCVAVGTLILCNDCSDLNRSFSLSLYSLARCRLFQESRCRILLFFNLVFWVISDCFCVWTCANMSFYIVSITTLLVNVFDGWCRYL